VKNIPWNSPMPHVYDLHVPDARRGERLDRFLAAALPSVSRERIKKAIRCGHCLLDGRVCAAPSTRLAPGRRIELRIEPDRDGPTPEAGALNLVWHDKDLVVLDKPAGLAVHPCPSCPASTLVHRLLAHFPQMSSLEGLRPGIVHRLDKDTSGLIVAALNEGARLKLSSDFARREVEKEYLALVRGVPNPKQGDIQAPIGRHPRQKIKMALVPEAQGGKAAHSAYAVLHADPLERFSLVRVRIFTGRTHQIRVHMASIGHPLWGDALYGGAKGPAARQMLHAHRLAFTHPTTGERLRFTCPPPPDFLRAALSLGRRMRRLVVVGAPGSGKSALLRLLEKAGLPCFSSDAAIRLLYEKGGDGRLCLHQRYGGRFTSDGDVDRNALFAAMRDDGRILREVQDMIHPLARHALEQFWRQAESANVECAAAEVPLYLENGGHGGADFAAPLLVGVYCDDAERRRRLADGRGWSEETQAVIDSWQWPQEKKMKACDLTVNNSASVEHLERQAEDLLARGRALRQKDDEDFISGLAALWDR
jgi:23S rRNA pseudouridine1911/1915/1917 synthase